MNPPCVGELQFWEVMRAQMKAQTEQLTRIADALEARNFKDGLPASQHVVDEIVAKGPSA